MFKVRILTNHSVLSMETEHYFVSIITGVVCDFFMNANHGSKCNVPSDNSTLKVLHWTSQ